MRTTRRIWFRACVGASMAFLAACSGTIPPPNPGVDAGPTCIPATCAALGKDCGQLPDGCGGALSCGVCTAGQSCGGGGVANLCGAGACTLKTCAALGKNCGTISDGCGATLACGTCGGSQICGGGGVANVCGVPSCSPTTCAAEHKNCGDLPDGCGGAVVCGTCPSGQVCGGGGVANVCGVGPCIPTTCAALGKNCGSVSDGCGGALQCGTCATGQVCTANVCGPPACTPTTCAAAGKNCGSIQDGCGHALDCGACAAGQSCGVGGVANVCGTPACTPTTCAATGKNCGSIQDGCGHALDCGSCTNGQTCAGGGTANVCGGAWVSTVSGPGDDDVVGVAGDPFGNTVALVVDSAAPQPVGLRKLTSNGRTVWTKYFAGSAGQNFSVGTTLKTDGSGNSYLLWAAGCADSGCQGTIDFGAGPTRAAALVKFDPQGNLIWQDNAMEDGAELAVDPAGEATYFAWFANDAALRYLTRVRPDGTVVWTKSSRGLRAIGVDTTGNVLVGALGGPSDAVFNQFFGSTGPVVAKLDAASGAVVWEERVAEGTVGEISSIGASAVGTVVVAGSITGSFDFGGQHFDTTGDPTTAMLFVFESGGQRRLARRLANASPGTLRLAVDPPGKVSVVGNFGNQTLVTHYNLAGDLLWTRSLMPVTSLALAITAAHETVLAGHFTGTPEFPGSPTAVGQDGFIFDLGQ